MENTQEKQRRRTPMTTNKWFVILLLLTIPLVNIYYIIYWAFIQKISQTRRNFSRAVILWVIIFVLIVVLAFIVFQHEIQSMFSIFKEIRQTFLI